MIELVQNCWHWISSHAATIAATVATTDFLVLVWTLFKLRKQDKMLSDNTNATNALNESTKALNETKRAIDDNTLELKNLKDYNKRLEIENERLKANVDEGVCKMNSVLDVLSVVYGTLKDETIRKTVQNIILNAQYNETATRVELQRQLEELKLKVVEDAEKVKQDISNVADDAMATIAKTKKKTSTRY